MAFTELQQSDYTSGLTSVALVVSISRRRETCRMKTYSKRIGAETSRARRETDGMEEDAIPVSPVFL